jgi:uncharacterized protein
MNRARTASRGRQRADPAWRLGAWPPRVWCWPLVWMLAIAGCAGSPPSTFFSLSPLPAAAGQGAMTGGALAIGLGPVTFPAFLDRPQIVSRDAGNRLAVDEYNRWGGTIQDDFLRVWSENLAYLVGTSRILLFPSEVRYPLDFRITADILTFEGTPGGEAMLKVRWAVLDPLLERALAVHETTYRQPLRPPADQAALIAAMSAALGAFSEDVAAVLRTLPKPLATRDLDRPRAAVSSGGDHL